MSQTNFKTPTIIIPNTTPGIDWQNPNNLLYADDQFAVATGGTQVLTAGYVGAINIPVGATIDNIVVAVKGFRGSFNTTLDIFAVDFSSGIPVSYQMFPSFQGFSGINTLYTLPATLFGNIWSVNAINNLGIKLIANGELHLDTVEVNVIFTPVVLPPTTTILNYNTLVGTFQVGETITGSISGTVAIIVSDDGVSVMTLSNVIGTFQIGETITGGTSGATAIVSNPTGLFVCDEFVQAQPFQLAQSMTSSSLTCLLTSFNFPDGTPIQIGDFFGEALITIEQGIPGKEENARVVSIDQNFQGTGFTRLNFGTLSNRGLGYDWPYTTVPSLRQDHSGTSEVVISNSAPFYDRFIKKCQADALFSPPITVQDEGVDLTTSLHVLNFLGEGVTAVLNSLHKIYATITDRFVRVSAVDTTSNYLSNKLIAGTNITLTPSGPGNETLTINSSGSGGGHIIEDNGIPLPQEATLNFVNHFIVTDNPGVSTDVNIDVVGLANDVTFINALVTNTTFITNIQAIAGAAGNTFLVDQTPDNGTYGLLGGAVNGVNTIFTVFAGQYVTGKLVVFLNGLVQLQGATDDWQETTPGSGTFTFNTAPLTGSVITVVYQETSVGLQTGIQFEDEGINLGTSGTVDELDFTGSGVSASRVGNKVTVNVTSGGGSGTDLSVSVNQVAHGLSVGDVIKSNGTDNQFAKAQANNAVNSEAVGIVTVVTDVDNFTYTSSAIQLSGAFVPAGTPGSALWLDPSVAGGITITKPSTLGQIARGLGTIIASGAKMYFDIAALAEEVGVIDGYQIDQTPDNGTYGLLSGVVNGINTTFTTSLVGYNSGKLIVYLNGLAQLQGATDDWVETNPTAGTFDFNVAPLTGDIITVSYGATGLGISSVPTVQVFTLSGTWTKPSGLLYAVVELVGGGGGGDNAGTDSAGSGGGGGGYSKKIINTITLGVTETITIGAGGAAQATGGTSSFGTHLQATGGVGAVGTGGTGGIGSLGNINIAGQGGGAGTDLSAGNASGLGGSSLLGGGGAGVEGSSTGISGGVYGGGGSGASQDGSGSLAGGTGAPGVVIVYEYY